MNLLIAVSGGRDSVVLLHWLLAQGRSNLVVCHLNHGLRGRDSGLDARFVRHLAQSLGLPCEIAKTDVAALAAENRLSLETAARQARHSFFLQAAAKYHTPHVFLAHHAEDQAETVLANACRGTGLAGLAGMKPLQQLDNGLILHRPLLSWRRAEIDAYIATHRLRFRDDSSNTSPAHRRNRLRHDILPRHWLAALNVPSLDQSHIDEAAGLLFNLRPARVNLPQQLQLRRKSRHLLLERL